MRWSFVCIFLLLFQGNCLSEETTDTNEKYETTTIENLSNNFEDYKDLEIIEGTSYPPKSLENDTLINYKGNLTTEKLAEVLNTTELPELTTSLQEGSFSDVEVLEESIPDNEIPNNKLINRMGFADYDTDQISNRKETQRDSHDVWKPVWPYGTPSPGLKQSPPTLLQSEFVTTTQPIIRTVSKEPVTAYYFDISHTALPPVGPLHDPSVLKRKTQNKTVVGLVRNTPLSTSTIETGPEYSVHPSIVANNIQATYEPSMAESEELIAHVRSDHNINLTFATVLPPVNDADVVREKETSPTVLKPKRVSSKVPVVITSPNIESSMSDITTGTTENLKPSLVPAPTNSIMQSNPKLGKPFTRTPLWVRLSSKSSVSTLLTTPFLTSTQPTASIRNASNSALASTKIPLENSTQLTHSHRVISTKNTALVTGRLPSSNSSTATDATNIVDFSTRPSVDDSFIPSNFSISVPVQEIVPPTTEATVPPESVTSPLNTVRTSMLPVNITFSDKVVSSTQNTNESNLNENATEKGFSDLLTESNETSEFLNDDAVSVKPGEPKITVESPIQTEGTSSTTEKTNFPIILIDEKDSASTTAPERTAGHVTPNKPESQPSTPILESSMVPVSHVESPRITDLARKSENEEISSLVSPTEVFPTPAAKPNPVTETAAADKTVLYSSLATDKKDAAPDAMILPTTGKHLTPSSTAVAEKKMITTVIKHFPGESEPELKIIEMHNNGTNFTKSSPYVKADLSYSMKEFCRHQDHIRSLLGEWINNHLKNETHSPKYAVKFFGTPNCSEMEQEPVAKSQNTTILYFYVVGDGKIKPNVTVQYPRNPTKLQISQKLAYLKEKILNLELVNAISTSNDLVLEEAAVGTSILVIVLSSIVLIFILISSVLAFIIVKKRRAADQTHGRRCTPADTYSMDSISVFYQSLRRKSKKRQSNKSLKSYLNQGFDDPNSPSRPLNFAKLTHFISDIEGIYNEFMKIPSINPKYDEMPRGIEDKNRYANVIPVPETRVFLKNNVATPYEEYINANYIHGARGESKYYIATQAPMDNTVADFWQMIWEEESKVIVMLTDFVEKGIDKCADYLPPSETLDCHRVYGEFQITLKSRDMKEKYVVSQVQLKNLENNLVREIAHMWYTGWPYTGIPNEEKSFISFIFETRAMRKKLRAKGPIVVHCSPGTGRSGTFVGCDISMRNFDDQKSVDIPKTVWRLRRERAGAVQTKEQYAYIYRVTNLYAAKLMTGNLDLF